MFTVVADVHLPIGLQVTGMGELAPVLGNIDDAFTNISVKNTEAVTESPAELAALFPNVLDLVLPQLSGGLSPISLPALGGLALDVTSITVCGQPGGADVVPRDLREPRAGDGRACRSRPRPRSARSPSRPRRWSPNPRRWRGARAPAVQLDLGGDVADLEFSYRIDGGTWSAWSRNAHPTLSPSVFWLPGTHHIEVRARQIGHPSTIDPTPVSLRVELGTGAVRRSPCAASTARPARPAATAPPAARPPTRRRSCSCSARSSCRCAGCAGGPRSSRGAPRLGAVAWLAAIAALPGCSCGADYCGDNACLEGDIEGGGIGRFTSIAADDNRVLVATYDQTLGDLVVVDVTDPAKPEKVAVDGIPSDATPTHEKGSYRDGIEEPGPNVGAWTSIAISDGLAKVAYQDRDAGTLKYAYEKKAGVWESFVVDNADGGEEVGRYASMAIDGEGRPAIAYVALGIDDGTGQRVTELRIARAGAREPGASDWTSHVVAAAPGTCAGLCATGEACIVDADAGFETCAATTNDCATACGTGDACIAGACTAAIANPSVADIGTGTGLFVSLVVLPDGRLAAAYYNRTGRALELAVESAAGSNEFAASVLDGGASGDRGMWASAVVDGAGTIHVAYQDAIGDQLMYLTWNGAPSTPEVVDDGQRPGDRTHPVGAGAAIYLVGGAPAIAYQDGLTSDVYIATRGAASWTQTALSTGPLLDGFSIAATTGFGGAPYLAWDRLDPSLTPPNGLAVETP